VVTTGPAPTTIDKALSLNEAPVSVTRTVKLYVPGVTGVPLITPVLLFNVRFDGKVPFRIDQLNGVVPPVAVKV
jgi:hypothetical protein